MNYYFVRWECDTGCGEIDETEDADGMPLGWKKIDGEELCEQCAKDADEESTD